MIKRWTLSFKLFLLTFLPVLGAVVTYSYFYYRLVRENWFQGLLLWWVICVGILIWTFWMSRRYFLMPILRLTETVKRVSHGDLEVRIRVKNRDELSDLALHFNRMVEDLKKTMVSRDTLDHLLQFLPEATVFFDENRKIRTFNQRAEELFGTPASEALSLEATALIAPSVRVLFENYLEEFGSSDSPVFHRLDLELKGLRKNREEFPMGATFSKTILDGKSVLSVIFRDMTNENEAQAREQRLLEERMEASGRERQRLGELEDAQKAYLNIIEDLELRRKEVEEREKELRSVQNQLVQSAKLAMVGQLASGVAHEINNPLQAITTNLDVAGMVLRDEASSIEEELPEILEDTKRATQRCREIIQGLLRFAKPNSPRLEELSLQQPLLESLTLTQTQLRQERIQVEQKFPDTLPRVRGNSRELMQVFVNMILNAARAMASAGEKKLTIAAELKGGEIVVSFRDTGHGIPKEVLPRIFEPFFTTSYEEGEGKLKGTGLGLSICHRIIQEHRGRIEVKSEPGAGAVFNIYLPLLPPS